MEEERGPFKCLCCWSERSELRSIKFEECSMLVSRRRSPTQSSCIHALASGYWDTHEEDEDRNLEEAAAKEHSSA